MTEAAIVVAVEKGIISEDLKEKLMDYAQAGFKQASDTAEKRWTRSNPFSELISYRVEYVILSLLVLLTGISMLVYRMLNHRRQ